VIALDTNVLVRILVEDDAKQTAKAAALVAGLERTQERAYVPEMVVCELCWVLATCYDFGRAEIVAAMRRLTAAKQLVFDRYDAVLRALQAYETGRGDFADYLIREVARAAGCTTVATFDRKLLHDEMFSSP
jgi:predicted nucleic-acid-binding protein